MRLHLLLLLLISGLSPTLGYAETLVGDWYQDETENHLNIERWAFSQPISQSTEATQVTLGINSPGLVDPIEFYAVISDKLPDDNCQYVVREITIDAEPFTIGSNAHSSDMTQLLTKTDDEQAKLWRAFKKGQNLSLKIHQTCSSANVQIDEVNTFAFSLTGSSSAYRFVARQEATVNPKQETREISGSGGATESEGVSGDSGTPSEGEFNYQILYFLISYYCCFVHAYIFHNRCYYLLYFR